MKLEYGKQAYQWPGGVGVMVLGAWHDGEQVAITTEGRGYLSMLRSVDQVLVAHSHTRELEFIAWGSLTPYPSEPIPEPGSKDLPDQPGWWKHTPSGREYCFDFHTGQIRAHLGFTTIYSTGIPKGGWVQVAS
jgi:hypothetical protein